MIKPLSGSHHSTAFWDPLIHNDSTLLTTPASPARCVFETMERMVRNHLYNQAGVREWLYSEQVGFRKLGSREGPILQITQTITHGFQTTKPQRSLMALLGFSGVEKNSCLQCPPRVPYRYATFCQTAWSRLKAKGVTRHH